MVRDAERDPVELLAYSLAGMVDSAITMHGVPGGGVPGRDVSLRLWNLLTDYVRSRVAAPGPSPTLDERREAVAALMRGAADCQRNFAAEVS